jgi:hypothetical protein
VEEILLPWRLKSQKYPVSEETMKNRCWVEV